MTPPDFFARSRSLLSPRARLAFALCSTLFAWGGATATAHAAEPAARAGELAQDKPREELATSLDEGGEAKVPENLPELILPTGRTKRRAPERKVIFAEVHGEYQMRLQFQRSFLMAPTATSIDKNPGLLEESMGQNAFLSHWFRLDPRIAIDDKIQIVSQADVLTGLVIGQLAQGVGADTTARDAYNGFSNIQLRWLYAEMKLPVGLVRVGQQPNHWGLGLLANDGNHPTLFGDYRYGSISERILFATKPGGEDSDFRVAVAGDLVYRDANARLTRGDYAFQGVLAAYFERGQNQVGVFSTLRHQTSERGASDFSAYSDVIDVGAVDVFGKFAAPVPGHDAFLFGAVEGALLVGSTNAVRTLAQARDNERTAIRSYGGAAIVGIAHRTHGCAACKGAPGEKQTWGDLVAQVEVGYASGDADPYDGTQKRFTIDGNHRIGLVLFDEVLRFQTARAATAARDPLLTNGSRPPPGIDRYASNGGIFGASYINPTFVYRPTPNLDLKSGLVLAQATADVVDPYRTSTSGSYVNATGGSPKAKDFGTEIDLGFEWRKPLSLGVLSLGAQGGVLFPGDALANAVGTRMKAPWVFVSRLGLNF